MTAKIIEVIIVVKKNFLTLSDMEFWHLITQEGSSKKKVVSNHHELFFSEK